MSSVLDAFVLGAFLLGAYVVDHSESEPSEPGQNLIHEDGVAGVRLSVEKLRDQARSATYVVRDFIIATVDVCFIDAEQLEVNIVDGRVAEVLAIVILTVDASGVVGWKVREAASAVIDSAP